LCQAFARVWHTLNRNFSVTKKADADFANDCTVDRGSHVQLYGVASWPSGAEPSATMQVYDTAEY
jgi:hypothetical protein